MVTRMHRTTAPQLDPKVLDQIVQLLVDAAQPSRIFLYRSNPCRRLLCEGAGCVIWPSGRTLEVRAMLEMDQPRVEFLVLAEHVEVIHGKLYVMGGGWETIHTGPPDAPAPIHFAVSVLVPWQTTNLPHVLTVSFQSADGETLSQFEQQILVGRPAGIEPGTEQRQILAFHVPLVFPGPGRHVALAALNDAPAVRVPFRAVSHRHSP